MTAQLQDYMLDDIQNLIIQRLDPLALRWLQVCPLGIPFDECASLATSDASKSETSTGSTEHSPSNGQHCKLGILLNSWKRAKNLADAQNENFVNTQSIIHHAVLLFRSKLLSNLSFCSY